MRVRFSVGFAVSGLMTVVWAPVGAVGGTPESLVATQLIAAPALPSDFNGDGIEDMAIAAPWDKPNDGSVTVRYGANAAGERLPRDVFHTNTAGIASLLRLYPGLLGWQVASGDFDRDGFADLAMSVPGFDEPDPDVQRINVGAVVVVYGTSTGLDPLGPQPAQVWSQDSPGVQGISEDDDFFGSSLAVGDYDGDGYRDLAIGADGERTGPTLRYSGSLTVLYGGWAGLTGRDQIITQDTRGILDTSEAGDRVADALAPGDFNNDGVDDLAVGVTSEDLGSQPNAGAVNVIYGTRDVGLTGVGDRFVSQALAAVPGAAERNDLFGTVLATGDFNGDHFDDLAVGAPGEKVGDQVAAGAVSTVYGSSTGLAMATSRTTYLASSEPGVWAYEANFGGALASGDVEGDGYDELAVGSPGYSGRFGRVDVLPGSADGLGTAPAASTAVSLSDPEIAADRGMFGAALRFGRFDTNPGSDLVVGTPWAVVTPAGGSPVRAGAVLVLLSQAGLLTPDRWLRQGGPTIGGVPTASENFGMSVPGSYGYSAW